MSEMTLRDALRALRSKLGLTQQQFSQKMGLSLRTVAASETGSVASLPADVLMHLHFLAIDADADDLADFFVESLLANYANRDARELGGLVCSFLPLNLKEMRVVGELLRLMRDQDPDIKPIIEEIQLLVERRRLNQKLEVERLKEKKPGQTLRDWIQGSKSESPGSLRDLVSFPQSEPDEEKAKPRRKP